MLKVCLAAHGLGPRPLTLSPEAVAYLNARCLDRYGFCLLMISLVLGPVIAGKALSHSIFRRTRFNSIDEALRL